MYRADLDAVPDFAAAAMDRAASLRLATPALRRRLLRGRALAREVLSRYVGVPGPDLVIDRTCPECGEQHGKPSLAAPPPYFSVSRSGRTFVMAVATSPVGVDIERLRRMDFAGIAAKEFSPAEAAHVVALSGHRQADAFARLWVRKEAMGKAIGSGLTPQVLRTDVLGAPGRAGEWTLIDLDLGPRLRAALAVGPANPKVRITELA